MKISNEWWTAPTESENGRLVMVTGRRDMEQVMSSGKYNDRVEVTWKYEGEANGMPDKPTSMLMEEVTESLQAVFKKDPVAIMTGIYTGDDERNWVFYVKNMHIFGHRFNQALEQFDLLPIDLYAEKDPDWEEYREMKEHSYIDDGE